MSSVWLHQGIYNTHTLAAAVTIPSKSDSNPHKGEINKVQNTPKTNVSQTSVLSTSIRLFTVDHLPRSTWSTKQLRRDHLALLNTIVMITQNSHENDSRVCYNCHSKMLLHVA